MTVIAIVGTTKVVWYFVGSAIPACPMTGEASQNAGYISQKQCSTNYSGGGWFGRYSLNPKVNQYLKKNYLYFQ